MSWWQRTPEQLHETCYDFGLDDNVEWTGDPLSGAALFLGKRKDNRCMTIVANNRPHIVFVSTVIGFEIFKVLANSESDWHVKEVEADLKRIYPELFAGTGCEKEEDEDENGGEDNEDDDEAS